MNTASRDCFRQGLDEFNNECFFEAHEAWEEIWLASEEPQKRFLQGIIQIAAAFHHYQRGNRRGARSLLEAGLRRVEGFAADHCGIELEELRRAGGEWAIALQEERDLDRKQFPKIQMAHGYERGNGLPGAD